MIEVSVTTYKGVPYTTHWYPSHFDAKRAIETIKALGYKASIVK